MKKLDKLVLGAIIGPFVITLLVVVFILLNVNMLKYFDDLIGKGLDYWTLGQFFFHFAVFTIPTALPLAVLLACLIAFGNLGEHFELTAIKASGVSLVRTLLPIFIFVLLLTVAAFFVNNNLVPKSALEAYSLLYDIKQKKPALDLREGAFYNGIPDISIKVNKKFPDGITLRDVIVYDHRKNDGNKEVTIADSGKMYTILNERYLKFELFNGYNYTEGAASERELSGQKSRNSETLSRSKFGKTQVVFDLSSFNLERTEKKWFQGNRMMRDLTQLDGDIDSMRREVLTQRLNYYQYKPSFFTYYYRKDSVVFPAEVYAHKLYRDSLSSAPYLERNRRELSPAASTPVTTPPPVAVTPAKTEPAKTTTPAAVKPTIKPSPTKREAEKLAAKKARERRQAKARSVAAANKSKSASIKPTPSVTPPKKKVFTDSARRAKIDSIFLIHTNRDTYQAAANQARQVKSQIQTFNNGVANGEQELRTFKIQWHRIFANSFACLAMFLIGAPLGAIIKRGGLGVPFLVSILFFIIYYVLTMQGDKLAKQGSINIIAGVWMADFVLFIVGLFCLRQARVDARLFEADFYRVAIDKIKRWLSRKKTEKLQGI